MESALISTIPEPKALDPNFFDSCTVIKVGKDGRILTKEYGWLSLDWKYINSLTDFQRQRILDSMGRMLERRQREAA